MSIYKNKFILVYNVFHHITDLRVLTLLEKKTTLSYRCIRNCIGAFYPKYQVFGEENLPDGPCIVAGNHSQINGPVACELYFPGDHATWTIGEMFHKETIPEYAFQDFWSLRPKSVHWFYRILSHLIVPLSVCIFNNANTIPVYKDKKLNETIRMSQDCLIARRRVIIFPEEYAEHNNIVHNFRSGFVSVAKRHYEETGEIVSFVPLYVCPQLRRLNIGKPVLFDPEKHIKDEKKRICNYLMDEISEMAYALPRHKVVPYPNVPPKDFPENVRMESAVS